MTTTKDPSHSHMQECVLISVSPLMTPLKKLMIREQVDQGLKTKYIIRMSRNSSKDIRSLKLKIPGGSPISFCNKYTFLLWIKGCLARMES